MSLERLRAGKRKAVGAKQAVKAIQRGTAQAVYVARDADSVLVQEVVAAAQGKGIQVIYADSMAALGKACGIAVGAAAAALLDS